MAEKNLFRSHAPSNIALIKYMGKADGGLNLPANSSLSLTLNSFRTDAMVERVFSEQGKVIPHPKMRDAWSEEDLARMAKHIDRVKLSAQKLLKQFDLETDSSVVESDFYFSCQNTFPARAGIASSASSFAAVTLAAFRAIVRSPADFDHKWLRDPLLRVAVAEQSRMGSGSSCRSFDGPFVIWEGEKTRKVPSSFPPLTDLVLLVSREAKKISSSEAHRRVMSSPLWEGRIDRAHSRLKTIEKALLEGNRQSIAEAVWFEAQDMHSLFHTSAAPFTYWTEKTRQILQAAESWLALDCAPWITLDAGPNIHLIVPTSEASEWKNRISAQFPDLEILSDSSGEGAR